METNYSFSKMMDEMGYIVYTTRGFSMRPLIRQGKDIVTIQRYTKPPQKYDVVLFQRKNGQYVLHRILKVYEGRYWIIGDNCITGEMVNRDQIIGKMTSLKRNKRMIKETDRMYRLFSRVWYWIFPLRYCVWRVKMFVYRCSSFVKRRLLKIK